MNQLTGFCILAFLSALGDGSKMEQSVRTAADSTHGASSISWTTTITSRDEPGDPLIVSGTIFADDGVSPLGGITVYVYHTDAKGYYTYSTSGDRTPRLRGTMLTNADGRYEFRTIKPMPYPGRAIPAHIHFVLSGRGYAEQYDEVEFEGDRFLTAEDIAKSKKQGRFGTIQAVTRDTDGFLRCVKDIRLKKK